MVSGVRPRNPARWGPLLRFFVKPDSWKPPIAMRPPLPLRGRLKSIPEDFLVTELPLYPPSGDGEHALVLVEKRGLTTPMLQKALARALSVAERDLGCAGLKDRHAVTRQWISIPRTPLEKILALELEGIRILEAHQHKNKLRRGHLRGNAFEITVRDVEPEAFARVEAARASIEEVGYPNVFGPQRFGNRGDNHLLGEAIWQEDLPRFLEHLARPFPDVESPRVLEGRRLLGEERFEEAQTAFPREFEVERTAARHLAKTRGDPQGLFSSLPRLSREFLLSAWQSACFNAVAWARHEGHPPLLEGDVAMKTVNGACFLVSDLEAEGVRSARHEIVATGPLPGEKLLRPVGQAALVENAVLEALGVRMDEGKEAPLPGTRRPLRGFVKDFKIRPSSPDVLILSFELEAGAFATSLLQHLGFVMSEI